MYKPKFKDVQGLPHNLQGSRFRDSVVRHLASKSGILQLP